MAPLYASQQAPGFVNRLQNIAIVGAGGTIGSYIVSALLSKQTINVTAVTRTDSKSTFAQGVKIAQVDYTNTDTIVAALKGHDALIITLSVTAARDTQAKLIHAAAAASIPWILPNEFGMYNTDSAQNDTIGPSKTHDRALIESLHLSWIGLTCGFWYEHSLSHPELFGFDIANRRITLFDNGLQKLNSSTWAFTARAVAHIVSLPVLPHDEHDTRLSLDAYRNRMVFVSSFAVSQHDMFASLRRVTDTAESDWEVTAVSAQQRFVDARGEVRKGNFAMLGRCLYSRYFYEDAGLFEKGHGLENRRLGLLGESEEEVDRATERAVGLVESGYWERYGRR